MSGKRKGKGGRPGEPRGAAQAKRAARAGAPAGPLAYLGPLLTGHGSPWCDVCQDAPWSEAVTIFGGQAGSAGWSMAACSRCVDQVLDDVPDWAEKVTIVSLLPPG